jgi:4-hydroxy-2-oxoheptanedioate aldolase
MSNLDEILSTPGLDAVYVGPADLGLSLGGEPRGDQTDPKIVEAIQTILAACKKHKVYAGLHCGSTDYARKAIGWGFQFVTIQSDNALLVGAAKAAVGAMREGNVTGAKSSGGSMY